MQQNPALSPPRTSARRLVAVPPGSAGRSEVESFIRRVYADHFAADVRSFAPQLVALLDERDLVVAAVGWRDAATETLFLERYLDAPVQSRLGLPTRTGIVEVGHFAAGRPGEGRRLISHMVPHLAALGARWVVSTVTEELHHLFLRLGITPLVLGSADPALLGTDARHWGRYYDHRPLLMAGQVHAALRILRSRRAIA
jgi:hypothetical protein